MSALTIGDAIRVSDVALPSGVTTDVDPDSAVAIGQPPRVVSAEEAGEGVEGEGVEGATAEAGGGGEASEASSEEG